MIRCTSTVNEGKQCKLEYAAHAVHGFAKWLQIRAETKCSREIHISKAVEMACERNLWSSRL